MSGLIDLIQSDFPGNDLYFIEISVIDGNGDPYEVFRGSPKQLDSKHVTSVMKEPCCLYFFTVNGIHKDLASDLDSFRNFLVSKDYCWISDPLPPKIVGRTPTSVVFKWPELGYIGIKPRKDLHTISYYIEVAEGQKWSSKTNSSKYVSEIQINSDDYLVVCGGIDILTAEVTGLSPAKWYHYRLLVTCRGFVSRSESCSFCTYCAPPMTPHQPRIYETPGMGQFSAGEAHALIRWSNPESNGDPTNCYQLQIQQITSSGRIVPGDRVSKLTSKSNMIVASQTEGLKNTRDSNNRHSNAGENALSRPSSRPSSPSLHNRDLFIVTHLHSNHVSKSPSMLNGESFDEDEEEKPTHSSQKLVSAGPSETFSPWKTIYKNLDNKCIVPQPASDVIEWIVRVRARNSYGWSSYSSCLVVNARSFPSFFIAGFHSEEKMLDDIDEAKHVSGVSEVIPGTSTKKSALESVLEGKERVSAPPSRRHSVESTTPSGTLDSNLSNSNNNGGVSRRLSSMAALPSTSSRSGSSSTLGGNSHVPTTTTTPHPDLSIKQPLMDYSHPPPSSSDSVDGEDSTHLSSILSEDYLIQGESLLTI